MFYCLKSRNYWCGAGSGRVMCVLWYRTSRVRLFFLYSAPPPQVWLFFFCQACQTHSRKLSWRQRIQGNAAITVPSFADAKQDILQERKASSVPLHNKQRQITWTWSKLTDLGSPHSSLPPNRFLLKQSRLVLFATVV